MANFYYYAIESEKIDDIYKDQYLAVPAEISGFRQNDVVVLKDCANEKRRVITRVKRNQLKLIFPTKIGNFKTSNLRQHVFMSFLMDPDITCVICTGVAGSGKTFLSSLFACYHITHFNFKHKVIISRVPVSPSRKFDQGFIPGTLDEKMKPWMKVFHDNFDLSKQYLGISKTFPIEEQSLSYIKGLTWHNSIIIVDECEDLTKDELFAILTRVGTDSKLILLGDTAQTTEKGCQNSLPDIVKAFESNKMTTEEQLMVATITLNKCERSPFVSMILKILGSKADECDKEEWVL